MRENMNDKFYQFKKKLAWQLCHDMLSPPIPTIGSYRPNREDSEEEAREKKMEYDMRLEEIECERRRREPELLDKLDEVIERVRNSRHEKLIDNEEVWFTAAGSEVERPKLICGVCKNDNHQFFITDPHTGDTICVGVDNSGCGTVVQDHFVDEGQQYRKFADESEDRNHHGPDYDPLMPDSENLKTGIVGTDAAFKKLFRTHQEVEMNLSTIGNDDRRTRTAYRNKMKREAFDEMREIAANLSIHKSVLARAKEEFARFRDVREHVHNYSAVLAACLVLAYEDVSAVMDVTIQAPSYSRTEVTGYNVLDGLKKIVNSRDPIVTTLKNIKMGKWNLDNIREWLGVVLRKDYQSTLNCIIETLTKSTTSSSTNDSTPDTITNSSSPSPIDSSDNNNNNTTTTTNNNNKSNGFKKRKYPESVPSFFGSTTISNRKKRLIPSNNNTTASSTATTSTTSVGNGSNSGTRNATVPTFIPLTGESSTFGQKFIRLNFDNLLKEYDGVISVDQVRVLKEALKTRMTYEAALDEIATIESFQEGRQKTEKSSSKRITQSTNQLTIKEEKKEPEIKREPNNTTVLDRSSLGEIIVEDNDDIWSEVKRVSQIEAAIVSNEESIDYANKTSQTRGRRGTNSIFKFV